MGCIVPNEPSPPTSVATDAACESRQPISTWYGKTNGDLRIEVTAKRAGGGTNGVLIEAVLSQLFGACISGIDLLLTADPVIVKVYASPAEPDSTINGIANYLRAQVHDVRSVQVYSRSS
jgi:hypothetical protein